MNRRALSAVTAIVLIVLLFNGCSLRFASMDKLMHPPKLTGDNYQLQEAFEKAVGSDVVLKTPVKGSYQSAFVVCDADDDGGEEAFVFYVKESDASVVRMNVLDKVDGKWFSVTDMKGNGNGVYSVEFYDLNGDTVPEMLVGWSLYGSKVNRILTIYECAAWEDGSLGVEVLANEYYNEMAFVDVDFDGSSELFLVRFDDSGQIPQVFGSVYGMQKDLVSLIGEIKLDTNMSSVYSINTDFFSGDGKSMTRIFIDGIRSDTMVFTEVLTFDTVSASLMRLVENASQQTFRNMRVASRDIDGDGLLEIPMLSEMPGSSLKNESELSVGSISLVEWKSLGLSGRLSVRKRTVANGSGLYMLEIPAKWLGSVTVSESSVNHDMSVMQYDSKNAAEGDVLFVISAVYDRTSSAETSDFTGNSISLSSESGDKYVFEVAVTDSGKAFGITEEQIRELIKVN
ncbi:MAG: hypothetical protein GX051_00690 [Clostridiales bacterium]|nr:hypothetical protein [Clostridiales bacterium]